MSSTKTYSVEEVLNLMVADIQDPDFINVVKIEGWEKLTAEIRDRCILKLRELVDLRDGPAQSLAVDANALMEKLNQVKRSRSATPPAPDPDDPEEIEEDRRTEKEAHGALIKDNGRPCYPIELGFDIFDNPGQYKDILEYWQKKKHQLTKRLVFSDQWFEWKEFRSRQQRDRKHYARRDWFPKFQEFLQERRRKYGLDGDVCLCETVANQNKLQDWMEYQNYKLMKYEAMEEGLEKFQAELIAERKALADEGYAAFEEIENIEFGKYYGMCRDWGKKEGEVEKKQELAEWKLKVAKTRLEAAQLEELGETVERDRWIDWFEKEVISRQARMDELQPSVDEAKRDVEPYEQWISTRIREFVTKHGEYFEDSKEGRRLFEVEVKTAEYQSKVNKRYELTNRASEARHIHSHAGEDVDFAKKVLEVARTEDLAPIMERAALIKRIQKKVRFAEFHVEEEMELTRVLKLKKRVISTLGSISSLKEGMKRLEVLLDWIEQQRRELVGDSADAGRKSSPTRLVRDDSRAYPNNTNASKIQYPTQKRTRSQKTTTKSIVGPVDPSKISKTWKQTKDRRKTNTSHDILPAVEKKSADFNITEPKSDTAVPVKDGMSARLHHVRSARISKPTSKRPTGQRRDTTGMSPMRDRHRQTSKEPVEVSTSSTERVTTTLRRSTRVSRPSQSHRLGSK